MKHFLNLLVLVIFCISQLSGYASVLPYMPAPGTMITLSEKADLPLPLAIEFKNNNPFDFNFVLSRTGNNDPVFLKSEAERIAKYFFAAMTMPAKDLWVNLSPYEKNRITTPDMAKTELGQDLLGEDYVLKQLAASLTYPAIETGKKYWQTVSSLRAVAKQSRSEIATASPRDDTTNSLAKIWITPGEMLIHESDGKAAVAKAQLKVRAKDNDPALQYILPLIEQEVNQGAQFARLRQIYYSVMLAGWFKRKLHETVLSQTFFDKNKTQGANADDPAMREKIYNEYLKAFKAGVYNYTQREQTINKITRRQYFSGGAALGSATQAPVVQSSVKVAGYHVRIVGVPVVSHVMGEAPPPLSVPTQIRRVVVHNVGAVAPVRSPGKPAVVVPKRDLDERPTELHQIAASPEVSSTAQTAFQVDEFIIDANTGSATIPTDVAREVNERLFAWIREKILAASSGTDWDTAMVTHKSGRDGDWPVDVSAWQALAYTLIKNEANRMTINVKNPNSPKKRMLIEVLFFPEGDDVRVVLAPVASDEARELFDTLFDAEGSRPVCILQGIMKRLKRASFGDVPMHLAWQIDESLKVFFQKAREVLDITEERELTEEECDKAVVELLKREDIHLAVEDMQRWRLVAKKHGLGDKGVFFSLPYAGGEKSRVQRLWDVRNGSGEYHAAAHWSRKNNRVYISPLALMVEEGARCHPNSRMAYRRVERIARYEAKNFQNLEARLAYQDKVFLAVANLADSYDALGASPELRAASPVIFNGPQISRGLAPLCCEAILSLLREVFNNPRIEFSGQGNYIISGLVHGAYASGFKSDFTINEKLLRNFSGDCKGFLRIERKRDGGVEVFIHITDAERYEHTKAVTFTARDVNAQRRGRRGNNTPKPVTSAPGSNGGVEFEAASSGKMVKARSFGNAFDLDSAWESADILGVNFKVLEVLP